MIKKLVKAAKAQQNGCRAIIIIKTELMSLWISEGFQLVCGG
jgi:hypothetical protein